MLIVFSKTSRVRSTVTLKQYIIMGLPYYLINKQRKISYHVWYFVSFLFYNSGGNNKCRAEAMVTMVK